MSIFENCVTIDIEMWNGKMIRNGTKEHYHKETWYDDYVYNEVQRIQPR